MLDGLILYLQARSVGRPQQLEDYNPNASITNVVRSATLRPIASTNTLGFDRRLRTQMPFSLQV
jgi:hypothetical protein